ncbi:MAG TPA: CsgG/HfaB family protein [Thermoanaerobaculia bacterium]|nr:CsgG/HfaB family protein [Thermoanaerobaculia bacterium]
MRSSEGDGEIYRRTLIEKYERILIVGLAGAGNQLGVVIARERISNRGRSAMPGGPMGGMAPAAPHPKDVEREYRLEVINPKSGDSVKNLDLGPFLPEGLSLSDHGELILLHGKNLQLGTHEVRIYNVRSGKVEYQSTLGKSAKVVLAANGYTVDGASWQVTEGSTRAEGKARFNSHDLYSIAEYGVECSSSLSESRYKGKSFAVVKFTGASLEVGQMLSNGLALKLRNAGLSVVERERLEEVLGEQWTQSTGLTNDSQASAIGKLANAQYLAFGGLQQTGTTSSLTVRLVSVEEGNVVTGCEVNCRDCRPDDYQEGLGYLVSVWTAAK